MGRGSPPKRRTSEYDFDSDVAINKHQLDKCWLEQPSLMMRYGELAAEANKAAKLTQEKLKTIRSEIVLVCHRDGIPGIDKPVGGAIEAHYRKNEDYIEAKLEMIEAEHVAEVLQNAIAAFRNRRDALSNLVELHLAGYFSAPKEPKGSGYGKEADEKQGKRVDEQAQKRLKNKKEKEE